MFLFALSSQACRAKIADGHMKILFMPQCETNAANFLQCTTDVPSQQDETAVHVRTYQYVARVDEDVVRESHLEASMRVTLPGKPFAFQQTHGSPRDALHTICVAL